MTGGWPGKGLRGVDGGVMLAGATECCTRVCGAASPAVRTIPEVVGPVVILPNFELRPIDAVVGYWWIFLGRWACTGIVLKEQCTGCRGNKTVEHTCWTCSGHGYSNGITFSKCNGSKKITEPCKFCNGMGRKPAGQP